MYARLPEPAARRIYPVRRRPSYSIAQVMKVQMVLVILIPFPSILISEAAAIHQRLSLFNTSTKKFLVSIHHIKFAFIDAEQIHRLRFSER